MESSINMNSLMQMQLLNKMHTGNPVVDGLLYAGVLTFLPKLLLMITGWFQYIFGIVYFYGDRGARYIWKWAQNKHQFFDKSVEISYISDNKTINELYKAVHWYLSNAECIDFIRETPLKLSFEKKIESIREIDFDIDSINKHVVNNITKSLKYKDHTIYYRLASEIITVYSDKERNRENFIIYLSTEINKSTDVDIIEDFSRFCITEYKKSLTATVWKQLIYTHSGTKWTSKPSDNRRNIKNIVLQGTLHKDITNDVMSFIKSEEWYYARGIPYKRGYLFYGTPGNGKTSLISGISLECRRHMHYLNLADIASDADLMTLLNDIDYSKTTLLIEDIDGMDDAVKDRELAELEAPAAAVPDLQTSVMMATAAMLNSKSDDKPKMQKPKGTLTLSGLLNALDGIFSANGRILFMTSNRPDVLDKALLRTGRVDKKYEFRNATNSQVIDLFRVFYDIECPREKVVEDYMYSVSDISNIFITYREDPDKALDILTDGLESSIVRCSDVVSKGKEKLKTS